MQKFNIKYIRNMEYGILICDTTGDEWILREDNVLLHHNNRNKRGNIDYHRQCEVNGLYEAIKYISNHTKKYKRKPRVSKIERLFATI